MKKQPCNLRRIAYEYVSILEQAENPYALERQLDRLRRAGVAQEDIFYDVESGAEVDGPGFKTVIELIQSGEVAEIAVTRWTRLMRGDSLYQKFKEAVQSKGVQIYSLDQGYVDLDTASRRLQADLQALFSEHEQNMLRERARRGYVHQRYRQSVCPCPGTVKLPASYTKKQIKRLLTSEQEQIKEERNEETTP